MSKNASLVDLQVRVLADATTLCGKPHPEAGQIGTVKGRTPDGKQYQVVMGAGLINLPLDAFEVLGDDAAVATLPQLTSVERQVIADLIELARVVNLALDDSEEMEGDHGREHAIDGQHFDDVCEALHRLEELPDDKPGLRLGPAGRAEWALRAVLAGHAQAKKGGAA